MGKLTLILGGSNSGKSKFAECLIKKKEDVLYLATAEALDDEMKNKIENHRKLRSPGWKTIEEPIHIDKSIEKESEKFKVVIIECILLWINNITIKFSHLTENEIEEVALNKISSVMNIIRKNNNDCFVVSGEVGLGYIGESKSTRLYGRILGEVNQLLAEKAETVFFVTAGIPMKIK